MIYLDNAATSWPKPQSVADAAGHAIANFGNPGRSGHSLAINASQALYGCRESLARLLGGHAMDYVFGMSCTDMLNMAIHGMATPGCHMVTTALEHNSVLRPLHTLKNKGLAQYTIVQPQACGYISAESIARALQGNTALVIVNHASNVTGALQDIQAISALCRRHGVPLLVDAAQSAGYTPIDTERMGIDMLAFPGHKGLLGPQGSGGLYLSQGCRPDPLRQGGTGSMSTELEQPWEMPDRYESGTPPTPALCGMKAGVDLLLARRQKIWKHEAEITAQLLEGLGKIPDVTLYGPPAHAPRVGVVSFNIGDMESSLAADALGDTYGIACRAGLHCAPLAHLVLGTQSRGAIRLSPGMYTTAAEIDQALRAVHQLAKQAAP